MLPQAKAADVLLKGVVDADVPATMSLDADKVTWAVVTLIVGSALRHVHSGSRFQVGGRISLQTTYNPAASEVTIEINDNGSGIPKETLPLPASARSRSASRGTDVDAGSRRRGGPWRSD